MFRVVIISVGFSHTVINKGCVVNNKDLRARNMVFIIDAMEGLYALSSCADGIIALWTLQCSLRNSNNMLSCRYICMLSTIISS